MTNYLKALLALLQLLILSQSASGFSSISVHAPLRRSASALSSSLHESPSPPGDKPLPMLQQLKRGLASVACASALASSLLAPLQALAIESQVIGQIQGSGLVFKDTLEVERFEDPKIRGVTLYITNFQRPITERLTTSFLQDPSYASVACVKSAPTVAVADNINTSPQGEEVFQESKSLLFKTLRGKFPHRLIGTPPEVMVL